ncbi:putative oxidoreductase [Caenibius tardaugens NBRC 16725]|uniref:Putative oxidoreductase n=1 Tax=Caenibius tardaugens NBRC 16725 TaxID=1219035 RepID=U2ZSZ9_9SPHN|nr:LLM class flavin-dependent oxidoreductase [Caenibius tardaugens]AZI34954.1 LLM class flavin-dependent oxidoreductase [Caenibius tardaugens NBRC 16725]GAD48499.1 putative oxidoreductase [Caenibius tardaugens NBRC 16725]
MRFHYAESMTAVANYVPLAQAAEANGYAGYVIPDSLIYPKASDTQYSYTKDGGREFLENKPFVESFILATAIGIATSKLEMTTNVVKLPVRPPLYSAKLVSSIAALTNNRFNFGVGLSVWPEDYAAMGVDFAKRGKRFDECIEIVRGLCAGGYFEFHGEFYDLDPVKLNPVPTKPLPILIGGFSDAALKRAARHDGFMHAGNGTREEMAAMFAKIQDYRVEAGTQDKPYRIFATAMGEMTLDAVKRNQDIGITDMPIAFRNLYAVEEDTQPLQQKIDDLTRFADQVIAKL